MNTQTYGRNRFGSLAKENNACTETKSDCVKVSNPLDPSKLYQLQHDHTAQRMAKHLHRS